MIGFEDLVGERILTGVDFYEERALKIGGDGYYADDMRQVMRIKLDGVIYIATEDPDDGYRSSMGGFGILDKSDVTFNEFEPCRVIAQLRTTYNDSDGTADVLQLIDKNTGKLVLEVGTDNTDDYYPSFISFFDPTAMASNA